MFSYAPSVSFTRGRRRRRCYYYYCYCSDVKTMNRRTPRRRQVWLPYAVRVFYSDIRRPFWKEREFDCCCPFENDANIASRIRVVRSSAFTEGITNNNYSTSTQARIQDVHFWGRGGHHKHPFLRGGDWDHFSGAIFTFGGGGDLYPRLSRQSIRTKNNPWHVSI